MKRRSTHCGAVKLVYMNDCDCRLEGKVSGVEKQYVSVQCTMVQNLS